MGLTLTKDTSISDTIKSEFHAVTHIEVNNRNNKMEVTLGNYATEDDFDAEKSPISSSRVVIDMDKFDVGQKKVIDDFIDFLDDLLINGATLITEKDKDDWKDGVKVKKTKKGKE